MKDTDQILRELHQMVKVYRDASWMNQQIEQQRAVITSYLVEIQRLNRALERAHRRRKALRVAREFMTRVAENETGPVQRLADQYLEQLDRIRAGEE